MANSNEYGGFTKSQYFANLKKTLAQLTGKGSIIANERRYLQAHPPSTTPVATQPSTVNVPNYVPPAYVKWVQGAATGTGLPASIVAAQINDESGFDPSVTSPKGARGIAQFEPGTWKSYGSGNPYNPNDAQKAYINYMNALLRSYKGNIRNALAAYNAGPGNLAAGYGYADAILSKAGIAQSATTTSSGAGGYGGTRPGGEAQTTNGQDTGQGVLSVLSQYETEITMPRTAPSSGFVSLGQAGWKAPFQWWWQSFSSNWTNETGE